MKNRDIILQYILGLSKPIQYTNLKEKLPEIKESTLIRNLNKLIQEGKIEKNNSWKNSFYSLSGWGFSKNYLAKPFFEREKKMYNFDFLRSYIPNETSFLWDGYETIKEKYNDLENLSTYDYMSNIRGIENLLIDLSFSSSKLEGNTYSYLDTEVLVKYNEEAEGKTREETQMILNHKNIIKYIIEYRKELVFSNKTFFEVHQILGKGLLLVDYLWRIRNKEVKIWGSTYTPLDNEFKLKEEFQLFLDKLNTIKNPFEQSLFILVFIPYFQIFMDINKRTSRISANIPLIKNGLAPLSLLQVKERDYITAILAIYELNDVSLIKKIFVDNYLLNIERYI